VPSCPGGVIIDQIPTNGLIVKPGRKIYVTINSLNQRKSVVPYVAEQSLRRAKNQLETAGFTIERLEYVKYPATNYVLAEYVNDVAITANSKLQAYVGTGVVLRVGVAADANSVSVPNVFGLKLSEAKSRIWDAGLNVGELSFDKGITMQDREDAMVYRQSLFSNSTTWHGNTVALSLTLSQDKVNGAISANDARIETERRAKILADSVAQAEKRMRDSIQSVNKPLLDEFQMPSQPVQHTEDNFF
jgi:beta-lactam-binding protein with PASTA domain